MAPNIDFSALSSRKSTKNHSSTFAIQGCSNRPRPMPYDTWGKLEILKDTVKKVKKFTCRRRGEEWAQHLDTLLSELEAPPSTRSVVVVGHTGHGKTTLFNSLLQCPLLTTATRRACTSAVVEVHYDDSLDYRATIEFLSKEAWEEFLSPLVADVHESTTSPSKFPPSDDVQKNLVLGSAATLVQIYPHLSGQLIDKDVSVESLSVHRSVTNMIGSSCEFTATSPAEMEKKLRGYISARQDKNKPTLWHMIKCAKIYGPFQMLATGTVLVDLPGFGDSNLIRVQKADQYLKDADSILLVLDIRRVIDHVDAREYLKKSIKRFVGFDGRAISDSALIIAVTRSDVQINDPQNAVQDQEGQDFLNNINNELDNYTEDIQRVGGGLQAGFEQLEQTLNGLHMQKHSFLALRRAERIRRYVQDLGASIYRAIDKESSAVLNPFSVHVVGSVDYQRLQNFDATQPDPMVFTNVADTGIPALQAQLSSVALHERLEKLMPTLTSFDSMMSEIHQYYKSQVTMDNQYISKATTVLEDLKKYNEITHNERIEGIGGLVDTLICTIQAAADQSTNTSYDTVVKLGNSIKSNSYKALVRRNGEWAGMDLNSQLTAGMEDGRVLEEWNTMFNVKLPAEIEKLTKDFTSEIEGAMDNIVEVVMLTETLATGSSTEGEPSTKRRKLDNETVDEIHQRRLSAKFEQFLMSAQRASSASMQAIQRGFGGTFKELIQKELEGRYRAAALETGKDMFTRMKAHLEEYLKTSSKELFQEVVERIKEPLSMIQEEIDSIYADALEKVYRVIKNTMLVEQRPLKDSEKKEIQQHLALLTQAQHTASGLRKRLCQDIDQAKKAIEATSSTTLHAH